MKLILLLQCLHRQILEGGHKRKRRQDYEERAQGFSKTIILIIRYQNC